MKHSRLLSSLLAFIMCLSAIVFCPFEEKTYAYGETFIIDPGHGGSDPGACGYGREEAADVLNLSFAVGELLSSVTSVTYTRTTDIDVSLQGRCDIANSNNNSYFCSIHRNAGGGTGVETYHYPGSSSGYNMAKAVNDRLASAAPWNNRGVKNAYFTVIGNTNMTAILAEVGFIDTAYDNTMFDTYFNELAFAIASGLCAYAGLPEPSGGSNKLMLDGMMPGEWGYFDALIVNLGSDTALVQSGGAGEKLVGSPSDGTDKNIWMFHYMGNYEYKIINRASGLCLDVPNFQDANVNMGVWNDNGGDAQRYYLYYRDGIFFIRPKTSLGSTRVLDTSLATGDCGLYPMHGGRNQQWSLFITSRNGASCSQAGDTFKATIARNGKYLTEGNDGEIIKALGQDTESGKQIWTFKRQWNGAYKIYGASGRLMAVEGGNTASGTNVVSAYATNGGEQEFYLYYSNGAYRLGPVHSSYTYLDLRHNDTEMMICGFESVNCDFVITKIDLDGLEPLNMGYFDAMLVNTVNGTALTASGEASSVVGCQAPAGEESVWMFHYMGDYLYEIINRKTGLRLDVPGGEDKNDLDISVYEDNDSAAQRFYIYKNSNGNYFIKPKVSSNRVLDIYRDTGRTVLWDFSGASETNQWTFVDPSELNKKLELNESSSYSENRTEGYVENVSVNATASSVLANFKNENAYIINADGAKVADEALVGTGYKACTDANGAVYDSLIIIIKGDVDGNGISDSTDYLRVKQYFLGSFSLYGVYFNAGDMDSSGTVDTTDYLKIKSGFLA